MSNRPAELDGVAQAGGCGPDQARFVERAETGEGPPDITLTQLARLQGTYEAAGVRIGYDGQVWKERAAKDPKR